MHAHDTCVPTFQFAGVKESVEAVVDVGRGTTDVISRQRRHEVPHGTQTTAQRATTTPTLPLSPSLLLPSVFRFRGVDLGNFLSSYKHFKEKKHYNRV